MARLTITAAAGSSSASLASLEGKVATFTAALATLVADGASPTEAHATAVNDAWTPIAAILAADFIMDYSRSTLTTGNLINTAIDAGRALAQQVR